MFNVMFQRRGWIEEYMAESSTARNQSSWRVFVITLSPALLLPSDCLSIVLQQKLPSSDECIYSVSSVQFSCSVVSDSLQPHEPQHTRPPCPSPTPEVHPNPCPLSRWCHPTISSSVVLFLSCPRSFPTSGSFQMSYFFASGGQSIGVSASTWIDVSELWCWRGLLRISWTARRSN